MSQLEASRRVVVVGASLAGLRTCEALRHEGFEGEIVAIGAEEHLPYDRPPLSKEFLAGNVDEGRLALRPREKLDGLNVEFDLGVRAVAMSLPDKAIALSDGREVLFDRLVIATGAYPRAISEFGDIDGVFLLRTLEDSLALRERLVPGCRLIVVGGGFLGMEVAATATKRGADVTVVEPLDTPLGRVVGPMVGQALMTEHVEHGVKVLTGVGVNNVRGSTRVEKVHLSDGTILDADVVVVAIGVIPETSWLEDSGLELDNGIVCDEGLRAAPDIWAVGDVARWPFDLAGGLVRLEHWTNATEQGGHVASAIARDDGDLHPFVGVPYFWSDHFDLKIQALGLPSPNADVEIVEGSIESRQFVACYGTKGKLTGVLSFNRPRQLMAFRKLIVVRSSFDEALAVPLS